MNQFGHFYIIHPEFTYQPPSNKSTVAASKAHPLRMFPVPRCLNAHNRSSSHSITSHRKGRTERRKKQLCVYLLTKSRIPGKCTQAPSPSPPSFIIRRARLAWASTQYIKEEKSPYSRRTTPKAMPDRSANVSTSMSDPTLVAPAVT